MDTAAALSAFSAAFGSGDVDAIMALMTDDCVFEATGPAPDGVAASRVRPPCARCGWSCSADAATRRSPRRSRSSPATGGCCAGGSTGPSDDGTPGHVRGVDVLRFRDGPVAEKLSYVKG